jgi:Tfp pilus assembly protein PilO
MNTVLGRILVERRAIIVPIAAVAVVTLGLLAFAVYPLSLRVASLERRASVARTQRAAAEREYAAARGLESGRERADTDLQQFYREVLPSDLAGARRLTYVRLAQLAHDTNLRYQHRSYESDSNYKGALEKLHIRMELEGDYPDVRAFIHELETSPDFVVIEGLALAEQVKGDEGEATLRLTLDMATYFRRGTHEP